MPDNAERFRLAYEEGLRKAVIDHPDEYAFGVEDVPKVVFRMINTIRTGQGFNHAGYGLKNTCRLLGIKHTQTAIRAFLKDEG
jgi:hypothetical protein